MSLSKTSEGFESLRGSMISKAFLLQLEGYGLTTANIFYRMPDHPSFLQNFIWQEYDAAPNFPVLNTFLDFWRREIEGPIHSVTVAHSKLIKPAEFKTVTGVITIH
jgi:uncharacterized protein Usg